MVFRSEKPIQYKQAVREAATICPCLLQVDLLTLKVVSESHVMWATSVPILLFLGFYVLNLGPMKATDRQTSDVHHRLMPLLWRRGIITTHSSKVRYSNELIRF